MTLVKLQYGNPRLEDVEVVRNSILLRDLILAGHLNSLVNLPYPSDAKTIEEVMYLISLQVDSKRLEKIERYEHNLYDEMALFLNSYGVEADSATIKSQLSVYDGIENYLKMKYNRPRPYQFAGAFSLPLYPRIRSDHGTAAYPSGHTLTSMWFRHIYMKSHPELADDLMDFVLDVKLSREQGGVHYPSDGTYSFIVYHRLKHVIDKYVYS
jgi:hypothetical protein